MFGDYSDSDDDGRNVRPPTPTKDLLQQAEERIARMNKLLSPLTQDERWQLPPEPEPREIPQRLFPQRREFKMVRALDDFSLPDPELVRSGRALHLFTRPGLELPSLTDTIARECTALLQDNPNIGFRNAFRSWALHPVQQNTLVQVFFWYLADLKRRDPAAAAIKELVFLCFSDHFVEEVMTCSQVSATYRDQIPNQWTRLCARVVFALCHLYFPNSAYRFNQDFLQSIEDNLRHWTTGHLPSELDKIRAAIADYARQERERGADPHQPLEVAKVKARRNSAFADLLTAGGVSVGPAVTVGALTPGKTVPSVPGLVSTGGEGLGGFVGLANAGKKALFDPYQRSPALRSYLERHGASRDIDLAVSRGTKEENLVRPRSHRRLGAPLKNVRVGPNQDLIDQITFHSLAKRALRSERGSETSSPDPLRPDGGATAAGTATTSPERGQGQPSTSQVIAALGAPSGPRATAGGTAALNAVLNSVMTMRREPATTGGGLTTAPTMNGGVGGTLHGTTTPGGVTKAPTTAHRHRSLAGQTGPIKHARPEDAPPSDTIVSAYQQTAKDLHGETVRARRKVHDQIKWLEAECAKASKSPERVARITSRMVGRIKLDGTDASGGADAAGASSGMGKGVPPHTGGGAYQSHSEQRSPKEMRDASSGKDVQAGQLLRSAVTRKSIRLSPSMAQISLDGPLEGRPSMTATKRKPEAANPDDMGIDTDAVVAQEVAERQALLRTLQEVQTKAQEKKARARETLRRILHEEEEVFEGLEAIVAESIPWPKAKDSRDLEAQMRATNARVAPVRSHYEPPRAIRIQRSAQGILRDLNNPYH